jgi:hypothetical protein
MELNMKTMNIRLAAIALGLAVAAIASPSFAQSNEDGVSPARAAALRQCSTQEQKYPEYLWGEAGDQIYAECMAAHGQPE